MKVARSRIHLMSRPRRSIPGTTQNAIGVRWGRLTPLGLAPPARSGCIFVAINVGGDVDAAVAILLTVSVVDVPDGDLAASVHRDNAPSGTPISSRVNQAPKTNWSSQRRRGHTCFTCRIP